MFFYGFDTELLKFIPKSVDVCIQVMSVEEDVAKFVNGCSGGGKVSMFPKQNLSLRWFGSGNTC